MEAEKPKRPRGRPVGTTKPECDKLSHRLDIPVTAAQKNKVAKRGGLAWVRSLIDEA